MSENSLVLNHLQAVTKQASRLLFIDNLRSAIIILVMLHHTAIIYGGAGSFYYLEPNDYIAKVVLTVLTAFDQAWFMGAFFLLSGYFSPGSFDRKGMGAFLKDRLIRLGIPLVFFYFILNPVAVIVGVNATSSTLTGITAPLTWQDYSALVGWGPLWFVSMLLIFDFGYAAWRWLTRKWASSMARSYKPPGYLMIGIFVLMLALASYLIRIPVPIDKYMLGFPTLAYLPQYLSFFCIGIVASRGNWLRTIPTSKGKWGFVAAVVVTLALFPIILIIGIKSREPLMGGGYWQSGVYALWDSTFAVGFLLALITLFRRFLDYQGRLTPLLSQQSYTVFIIHAPILVFLAVVLRGLYAENLLKFALLAVIAVPLCFALAYLIRKIPLVSRVL
jgi:glucan biosynthesis protein C